MKLITGWLKRTLENQQIVALMLVLIAVFLVIMTMGNMLAPVLASLVIAYLLEGVVAVGTRLGTPRLIAVIAVSFLFVIFLALVLFGLLPLLSIQISELVQQIPKMISKSQHALMALPETYPELVSIEQIEEIISISTRELVSFGQRLVSTSLSSVTGLITLMVYLILLPLLVFFFLKDKVLIINWISKFLPADRTFATKVWHEVDGQIANYVRGKFWEIIIVWAASIIAFSVLGLNYTMLLSVLVGLSVIIPYIGATVVTIPVMLVAWFQWGWGPDFGWLMASYMVIQILDGNVLVPLLFGEVVSLHPVAIIVAILVFGGFWGFWGVFFAIPLATLVNAIVQAWPAQIEIPLAGAGDPARQD
jgi:putative permease